eukprot:GHVR01117425.1.p1 GENE.GHVR01117425.1~~GHVR01117425.1.p1  ORF type:complete len:223 (-),score=47.17 GHVR01117425.1:176-844(-)
MDAPSSSSTRPKKLISTSLVDTILAEQRARIKTRGVSSVDTTEVPSNIDTDDVKPTRFGMLNKSFVTNDTEAHNEEDKYLEEYVRKNMNTTDTDPLNLSLEESRILDAAKLRELSIAKLYEIPEHLKVSNVQIEHSEKMAWVTGLVEVPISVEAKLRNIESTEKARRERAVMEGMLLPQFDKKIGTQAFGPRFQPLHVPYATATKPSDQDAVTRFRKKTKFY